MSLWNSEPTQWPLPRTQGALTLGFEELCMCKPILCCCFLMLKHARFSPLLLLLPRVCEAKLFQHHIPTLQNHSPHDITVNLLSRLMLTSFSCFSDELYQPSTNIRLAAELKTFLDMHVNYSVLVQTKPNSKTGFGVSPALYATLEKY